MWNFSIVDHIKFLKTPFRNDKVIYPIDDDTKFCF